MEYNQNTSLRADNKTYSDITNLLRLNKMHPDEIVKALTEKGFSKETACNIVFEVQEMLKVQKEKANKDMLYGGLWFAGGLVATLANFGLIFWGAIIFGAFQFFRGLMNSDFSL